MKKSKPKSKPKIFDLVTILLISILAGLVLVIFGILFWKEKNIETEAKFFDQFKVNQEFNQLVKGDEIMIFFSGPVQTESVLGKMRMEPSIDFEASWLNNHQLEVIVEDNLKPGENYQFILEGFRSKWGLLNSERRINFSTDPLPVLKNIYPVAGLIDTEADQEVSFEFQEPLADQYFLKIKTEPSFDFKTIETDVDSKIVIQPIEDLSYGTEYKILAEVRSKNYSYFSQELAETSFKTKQPPVVVYGLYSDGTPTKTEIRETLQEPLIKVGKYVDIDLSQQNLYIFENGQEEGAYKVSTGIRGMNTPAGQFRVIARARRPWSAKYGLYMPWFIQFTYEGHGIHELPEWPGGYKEGANHLGIPVSHGCVRLGIGPAKIVYDFVEIGTPIVIHY